MRKSVLWDSVKLRGLCVQMKVGYTFYIIQFDTVLIQGRAANPLLFLISYNKTLYEPSIERSSGGSYHEDLVSICLLDGS